MGSPVQPTPDPVTSYLAKYGGPRPSGGSAGSSPPDPVTSYLSKYGKAPTPPEKGSWQDAVATALTGGLSSDGAGVMGAIGGLLHGDTHLGDNYVKARDKAVTDAQGYAQSHPNANAAIQAIGSTVPVAGAMLATGGGAAPELVQGVGQRMLGGAAVGAAAEQVGRFNNAPGNLADRARATQSQGLPLGGLIFGAASPAVPAMASAMLDRWQGAPGVSRALNSVTDAIHKSGQTVPSVMQNLRNAPPDVPVVLADGMGNPGRQLVRAVTDNGALGADDLRRTLDARQLGQYDRWRQNTAQNMGQPFQSVPEAIDAAQAARSANANEAFGAANMNSLHNGPALQAALQDPGFQKAIDIGRGIAKTRDITASIKNGTQAVASTDAPLAKEVPVVQDSPTLSAPATGGTLYDHILQASGGDTQKAAQAMQALGEKVPVAAASPTAGAASAGPPSPMQGVTYAALDAARQYLRKGIQSGFDAESGFSHTSAQATHGLLNAVLDEAKTTNPAYGAALDKYGEDSAPINALENTGKNFWTSSPDENAYAMKGMDQTGPEMNAVRMSAMAQARDKAGSKDFQANIVNRWLNSPDAQTNMSMLAPSPEAAQNMQDFRDWEQKGALVNAAPSAGSNTSTATAGLARLRQGSTLAQMLVNPGRSKRIMATAIGSAIDMHQARTVNEALAPILRTDRSGLSNIEYQINQARLAAAARNAAGKISAGSMGLQLGGSGQNQ